MNIGKIARALIIANPNMSNADLCELTRKEAFAAGLDPKTTVACIAWYKNDLRKNGQRKGEHKVEVKPKTIDDIQLEIMMLQEKVLEMQEAEAQALIDEEQALRDKLAQIEAIKAAKVAAE